MNNTIRQEYVDACSLVAEGRVTRQIPEFIIDFDPVKAATGQAAVDNIIGQMIADGYAAKMKSKGSGRGEKYTVTYTPCLHKRSCGCFTFLTDHGVKILGPSLYVVYCNNIEPKYNKWNQDHPEKQLHLIPYDEFITRMLGHRT